MDVVQAAGKCVRPLMSSWKEQTARVGAIESSWNVGQGLKLKLRFAQWRFC